MKGPLMSSPKHTKQTPNLGLVCITQSDEVRYRTVTRTRLLQFPPVEQRRMLHTISRENLVRLNRAL